MADIRLKIVGIHYATNPEAWETKNSTEEMEERTIERLRKLSKERPRVILVPEPTNPADPMAIQARVKGAPLGYVARCEVEDAHRLFTSADKKMVSVTIDEVDVRRRGWLWVKTELPEECLLKEKGESMVADYWKTWKFDLPVMEPDDAWTACREAEFVLETMLPNPKESDIDELKEYMTVWTDKNLHDLSRDTKQMRNRYIASLLATHDVRLKPLAERLDKQRIAVCGDHRMTYRLEWWENLQNSAQMERYWGKWQSRKGFHLWKDLQLVDAHLRKLPNNLYTCIGRQSDIFATLYYLDVPRDILWSIYSLLLIRKRICQELDLDMKPMPEDGYGLTTNKETICLALPDELGTSEAGTLHDKLFRIGLLDENWQPTNLSTAEKGTLIEYIAEKLNIRNKWKFFGALWNVDSETLRTSKARGLDQDKTWKFREQLDAL